VRPYAWGDRTLHYLVVRMLSYPELQAELAGDTDEYRMELDVDQVTPRFAVPSAAFVPIRAGCEDAVAAALAAMTDRIQGVLAVRDAAELRAGTGSWYAGLPPAGKLVEVGHSTDRSYAGYGNLFRAIETIAPMLGDARFFISEDYSSWIDDYRIENGTLSVERSFADDEDHRAKQALLIAKARAGDRDLREAVGWQLAVSAGYAIPDRADYTPERERDPRERLMVAFELDARSHEVLFQLGRAARAAANDAAATEHFTRAIAVDDPRLPSRLTTMAATALAAGKADLARGWLERAPLDRTVALLLGRVELDGPAGDREAVPWTRNAETLLADYARQVAALDVDRVTAARELFAWAELYRIRTAHNVDKSRSRRIADLMFDAAAALDPLGGDIAAHRVFHDHGMRGDAALAGFLAVLDAFPAQAEALFWAASALHGSEQWAKAAELGRRYLRHATTRGSYERGAAATVLSDSLVRDAYERMARGELGAETEQALEDAIAIASPHGTWVGPWLGKADLYEYRREHHAALPLYDAAIARDPSSPHALSGKASCLHNLGRVDEAHACVDEALDAGGDYWHAHYVKACILARTGGDRDEIIAFARRALELEPAKRAQIVEEPDLAAYRNALDDL
jgi:tetratricopeptide (TPR) repeat protein